MGSTLPPTPSYNPNVPVVTPAGGTAAAYKDPNSPEAILRKTAALNAQARVDSQFDNATSAYAEPGSDVKQEGFTTSSFDTVYRWIHSLHLVFFLVVLLSVAALAIALGRTKRSELAAVGLILAVLLAARIFHLE